ncbi:RNA 2',3'-cyclic phosphodiesterase [Streptomyces prasinopilosus]|uniref:RNA 2',3'-cyclic phosphodiesterase n=1 Tax=Streptomyces prasinopilosus TaxID=67344 RepID=A0A1G6QN76_9ACTN|nr:RNA 2',3'-cyclic phosphodiesterase [Streptomyces prasinopilosus]SDC93763.1 2'-5' RNA ligase [Streptomyces prasinopilosus]
MRLFAAVLPPEDVSRELAAEIEELRRLPGADLLRWTGDSGRTRGAAVDRHFTLAFYGEVDDGLVPELTARLERAASRTGPFELALRGGGQFGHGRVLWAGADGDLPALRLLAERAQAAGRKAGVARGEHRRYKAHLTLARSGTGLDAQPYLRALAGFRSRSWTVDGLALVRSHLPGSGVPGERPRYEVVARCPLGAAG